GRARHNRCEWKVVTVEREPGPHHVLPCLRTRGDGGTVCEVKINGRKTAGDDLGGCVLKSHDLRCALRRVEDLGACDMREQAFESDVPRRVERPCHQV